MCAPVLTVQSRVATLVVRVLYHTNTAVLDEIWNHAMADSQTHSALQPNSTVCSQKNVVVHLGFDRASPRACRAAAELHVSHSAWIACPGWHRTSEQPRARMSRSAYEHALTVCYCRVQLTVPRAAQPMRKPPISRSTPTTRTGWTRQSALCLKCSRCAWLWSHTYHRTTWLACDVAQHERGHQSHMQPTPVHCKSLE